MTTPIKNTDTSYIVQDPDEKIIIPVAKAFEMAGGKGYYQKRLIALLSIQRIFIGYLFLSFPFLFKDPIFRCKDSDSPLAEWEICKPTIDNCKRIIEPLEGSDNTMIVKFDLYCDQRQLVAMCQTIFLATMVIGMFALATWPDTKGRKFSLLISNYATTIISFAAIMIPNKYISLGLIGFWGLTIGPNISYTFMYLNEVTDSEYRQFGTVMVNAVRSIGQMPLGILANWISNDWQLLILVYIAIPMAISIPLLHMWVDEPPGFLASKGQYVEARAVINKIANINGNNMRDFVFSEEIQKRIASPSIIRRYPPSQKALNTSTSFIGSIRKSIRMLQQVKTYHYPDLIKYNSLKSQVLYLTIVLIVQFFFNNAITWAVPAIDAPTSWVTFAISLGELVACFFGAFLYVHMKRRPLYVLCHALLCASCLPFAVLDAPLECAVGETTCWQSYMQVLLIVVSKIAVSVVVMLFYIYAAEVFPTPVRALGTGLVNVLARSASILSPMIIGFFMEEGLNPMTAMGIMGIPAIFVSFKLKETKGQPLQDEIEEERLLEMKLLETKTPVNMR